MVSDGQTVHFWPHSVIHNRKAVHLTYLKLWWKVNFRPPLKRQNFRDTYGLSCYPHLISCHMSYNSYLTRRGYMCNPWKFRNLFICGQLRTRNQMRVATQSVCVPKILALQRWSKIDFPPEFQTRQMHSFPIMYNTMGSKVDGLAVRDHFLPKMA